MHDIYKLKTNENISLISDHGVDMELESSIDLLNKYISFQGSTTAERIFYDIIPTSSRLYSILSAYDKPIIS